MKSEGHSNEVRGGRGEVRGAVLTSPLPPLTSPGNSERIKSRILVPLILAVAVLLGTFVFAFRQDRHKQSTRAAERSAQQVRNLLRLEQEQKTAVMKTTLQAILNDDRMGDAFGNLDREALLQRAQPLYWSLRGEHQITHLYFHLPGRANLLRVHRPEQRGDTINRYTAREAERTGRVASGIERGPIGTFVLRVVSPWRRDGKLLGYVELGVEFEDIVKNVHGLLNVDFVVAVYKQFLDREQWNKALKSYGKQGSWDQFPTTVVMDKTVETIPQPVVEYLSSKVPKSEVQSPKSDDQVQSPESKVQSLTLDSGLRTQNFGLGVTTQSLQLVFLPLADVSGKTLGELLVLQDITASLAQARASIRFVGLVCLAVGTVLVGLFYLLLTRVEKDLAQRASKLGAEILERQRAEDQLRQAHDHLEQRVEERTRELQSEIQERIDIQLQLEQTQSQLIETSRKAGMAEVATGVLHNVGNVLTSVNIASTCLAESLKKSKAANLSKVVALLREHEADLGAFLASDPKGKQLPDYLAQLAGHLTEKQAAALDELARLQKNIEHIREIVTMQQTYAKVSGDAEQLTVPELLEDALNMNLGTLKSRQIQVVKEFEAVPAITTEKHKVLQILVNLIRNAEYACEHSGRQDKRLTLRVTNANDRVRIAVSDNGVGIAPENLARLFAHGFTTKKTGHGFGLHSGARAARELRGSLGVHSDGPGRGATFTLELPLQPGRGEKGEGRDERGEVVAERAEGTSHRTPVTSHLSPHLSPFSPLTSHLSPHP